MSFEARAVIHSLNRNAEPLAPKITDLVTILWETDDNQYAAEYKGVMCSAMFNPFVGAYFVDDVYGIIKQEPARGQNPKETSEYPLIVAMPPESSPWGEVQNYTAIAPGMFEVDTASHGGIMMRHIVAQKELSPGARKVGIRENGYLCFEEDCAAAVVYRELLDRPNWKIPSNRTCTRAEFEKDVNTMLKYSSEYVAYRQRRMARSVKKEGKSPEQVR